MNEDKNPKLRKNGGNGTVVGNILRGVVEVGKQISPQFKAVLDAVQSPSDWNAVQGQLLKEAYTPSELIYLQSLLEKDKQELVEVTKRWEADMKSQSWLAQNVRPWTLVLYNISTILMIVLDSIASIDFEVKSIWINILISNTGIINTAYFGSRYLEKRDDKKYKG